LGKETLSAEKRLQAWTRDSDLMVHLEKHISEVYWPSPCPHPLCDAEVNDETSSWYHLSDAHNLRRASKKGQKRRWEAVASKNNDGLQPGTSHRDGKNLKMIRPKEAVKIRVIEYSSLHSLKPSPAWANGNSPREKRSRSPQRQLVTSVDPTISPPLISRSSTSLASRDYDLDTGHSTEPDLTYTGNTPSGSSTPYPTERYGSTRGSSDRDGSPSLLGLWTEPPVNSEESTDITVVDLTEDKSFEYDDLLSKYTTIPCSSVKDGDSNKGLLNLDSSKPFLPPEIETAPTDKINNN
jgi:hypothetical protein